MLKNSGLEIMEIGEIWSQPTRKKEEHQSLLCVGNQASNVSCAKERNL